MVRSTKIPMESGGDKFPAYWTIYGANEENGHRRLTDGEMLAGRFRADLRFCLVEEKQSKSQNPTDRKWRGN